MTAFQEALEMGNGCLKRGTMHYSGQGKGQTGVENNCVLSLVYLIVSARCALMKCPSRCL